MTLNILPENMPHPNLDPTTNASLVEARSGTELMRHRVFTNLDPALLSQFQIICPARFDGLVLTDRPKILWVHDLAVDPAVAKLQDPGFASQFEIVCVSHWQRAEFLRTFPHLTSQQITVLPNAMPRFTTPMPEKPLVDGRWQIIYTSTPHRGLAVLCGAIDALAKVRDDFDVHIYSSFDIYGSAWNQATAAFQDVFTFCQEHPRVVYHGTQSNLTVREALTRAHIFAYPSIYTETSCLAAIEAGAAGCAILTTGLGALPETLGGWAYYLPTVPHKRTGEELQQLATETYQHLHGLLRLLTLNAAHLAPRQQMQAEYFNAMYDWDARQLDWTRYLEGQLCRRR